MKCKSIACLIILLNIAGVIVLASSAYDSIECDPHSNRARTGRARLIESIPCDLNKQSYCNLPGESYPWNAVKKFVYDNQGLVRRMYGDVRHIFVMQSELENEIDFDDIKLTADKYSKAFNTHNKPRHRQMKAAKKVTAKATTTTTTTTRNVERKNYRSGDTSEPHFRPAQRPAAINTKQRTKPPKLVVNDQSEKTSLIDNLIQTNIESLTNTKLNEKSTSQTTTKLTSITSSSSTTPSSSTSEIMNDEDSNRIVDNHEQAYDDDESDHEKNETVDIAVIDLFSNISSAHSASSTSTVSTTEKLATETTSMSSSTTISSNSSEKPSIMTKNKVTTEENEELEETVDEILSELVNDSSSSASSISTDVDKIDDKGQTSKDPSLTTTTEAQLYQDAIPTANRRGVNACPVKEEVVAPFWGNNTRGEILALLNVYPFEQYINWEKCTNENEQMYCRKGCRCEQQYRLHRLLAYNPLDACRGIFSDWFRFPSCCICKCYDIPFDYRVTSRSPRGSDRVLDAISDNEDVENDDDDGFENDDEDSDGNYYFDDDYENE